MSKSDNNVMPLIQRARESKGEPATKALEHPDPVLRQMAIAWVRQLENPQRDDKVLLALLNGIIQMPVTHPKGITYKIGSAYAWACCSLDEQNPVRAILDAVLVHLDEAGDFTPLEDGAT